MTKVDDIIHTTLRIPYWIKGTIMRKGSRPYATVLFIHGIGNSAQAWREVVDQLPGGVKCVMVDLIGFGRSPRPQADAYDVATQARAVKLLCARHGIRGNVLIVGHSMGSLVAIELARRYPRFAHSLILCSPPLYQPSVKGVQLPTSDAVLRSLYRAARKSPEQFVRLSAVAMKYVLVNRAFNVTDENVASYMSALEAAIINQTSLDDIKTLHVPIRIIRGSLDPVLVSSRIKRLAKDQPNIAVLTILAGHEVRGRFAKKVVEEIVATLQQQ
jgi:pimeloyl-ACP methyl ester carboxylesterase